MITLDVRTETTWVHYQGGAFPFTTETEAYEFVARQIARNPELTWQVVA